MSKNERNARFYLKNLFVGSLAMTLVEATMKIAKFLTLPILTYYLSPKDFGIIASIKMIEGVLVMIYNPGIISGVTRKYYDTEDNEKRRLYIGSALFFFIFVSLLVTIIILLFGNSFFQTIFNEFELYPYGLVALIISLLIQPKRLWSALMTFQYRVPTIATFSLIQMLIDIALTLFMVAFLLMHLKGRITALVISVIFISIVSIFYLLKYTRGKFSIKTTWELFVFSVPLAPAIWAYSFLEIADRFLIEHYIGLEGLGLYSIGYIISSVPLFLSLGLRKMWSPIFFENMNDKKYERINTLVKYFVLLMALSVGLLIIFSPEIAMFMLDENFSSSLMIIPWVSSGIFFLGILPITSSFILYQNKFSRISINAIISAIFNIFINILLLPSIGIVGAGIATLSSYFIYFILNVYSSWNIFSKVVSIINLIIPLVFIILSFMIFYGFGISLFFFTLKLLFISVFITLIFLLGYISSKEINHIKDLLNFK